jgi:transcription initiation factor TFIIIB Brf1 subunit/transcription initiation factor TFIIB
MVKDLKENVIEAKPIVRSNATETEKKAPLPAGIAAAAMFIVAKLLNRRRRLLQLDT